MAEGPSARACVARRLRARRSAPPPFPATWKTWEEGHRAPRFAVEVVSGDERKRATWKKDHENAPAKYAQLGTSELVIFDPDVATGRAKHPTRFALQIYRREDDGGFMRVYAGSGPAASNAIDAWLVVVASRGSARLRIERDASGSVFVPTEAEAREQAERALAEARAEIERLRSGRQ